MANEMDGLIQAMSDEDLAGLKAKYSDQPSVATLIDGILETREAEAVQTKAKKDFTNGIAKLFAKLAHPEDIYNVYARWAEVEVEVGEEEEVYLREGVVLSELPPDSKAELEAGIITKEVRKPMAKVFQWVVEVNHATRTAVRTNGEPKTSKRAITVFKRNGTQLEPKGNYASASKACEALGLTIGGDSAMRVLARDGFITEAYDGTDYAS